MSSYQNVSDHRRMVFDSERNAAYEAALREVVTPDSIVVDVGAGAGILGLLAARLGARRVHLVEPTSVVRLAVDAAERMGCRDRVQIHEASVDVADLGEQADVLISVMTGNALMGEDLLPVLVKARKKYLRAGGIMIPSRSRLHAAPVSAETVHSDHVAQWSLRPMGIDFSSARQFAANTVVTVNRLESVELLSGTSVVADVDLASVDVPHVDGHARVIASRAGTIHGWLVWHDLSLGSQTLDLGIGSNTHWRPVLLPLDTPVNVEPGDTLELEVKRSTNGPWNWRIASSGHAEAHTNFLARPAGPSAYRSHNERSSQ